MSQLRTEYSIIRDIEKILPTLKNDAPREMAKQIIKDKKRYVRKITNAPVGNSRLVKDDGIDGYVELVSLPENIKSKAEAKEWFEENIYRTFFPTQYDCSGQAFTSWYKLFKRRGNFMAYHRIVFDV